MTASGLVTNQHIAVRTESLTKKYGDRLALSDVNLDVERGTVVGLLGPNGAGKSTLLETLAGLRKPSRGSVSVLGLAPWSERKALTQKVAVQPQTANVFGSLTVLETLRLYASLHSNPRDVRETIEDIGLTSQEMVRVQNLSGGQLRRLLFGVAVIGNPELAILDEPSAGLDPEAKQQLIGLIKNLRASGTTVLFSTHDMSEAAQACDRVVFLAVGQIRADGSPSQLIEEAHGSSTLHFEVSTEDALKKVLLMVGEENVEWQKDPGVWQMQVRSPDPDELLGRLTFDKSIRGRRYRVERLTLEELYLSIVRESRSNKEAGAVRV